MMLRNLWKKRPSRTAAVAGAAAAVVTPETLEDRRLLAAGGVLPLHTLLHSFAELTAASQLSDVQEVARRDRSAPSPVSTNSSRGSGPRQRTVSVEPVVANGAVAQNPSVRALTSPENRNNAPVDTLIAVTVRLPAGGGIDETTVNANTVRLFRGSAAGTPVAGQPNTTGGGDGIIFQPSDLLEPNTSYTFVVTEGVRDTHGNPFTPYSITFTTGSAVGATDPKIAFEKVYLPTAQGERYSSLVFGPDGRLYAGTLTGLIHVFNVNGDGTLSSPTVISTVQAAHNWDRRFLTGLRFDPASTPQNMVLWVTHGQYVADNGTLNWNAPDWSGKVSRLSGPGFAVYEDYVVGLPRSVRDHLTNQIDFGPDGMLYFGQASNNSMGAPDPIWGNRPERLLSGAILKLNPTLVAQRLAAGQGPLDVKTEEGGTYDPWAAGAPLTLHATGLRNVFDLVWHRNGQLYAPTNGSAAGGFTPAFAGGTTPRRIDGRTTSPAVPALSDVQQTEFDYLFKIDAGGYYGHPNPTRGEYVLQGGNPTAGVDDDEFTDYPVGTLPDANRRNDVFTFGRNYAPAGAIEYKGGTFGGALDGRLLVARYSGGDDVVVVTLDGAGNVAGVQSGLSGLTHFVDPLDIIQHPTNGYLYVSEHGSKRITLVRPLGAGANISVSRGLMALNDPVTSGAGPERTLTITNTGSTPLAIPSDGLRITGPEAAIFQITRRPVLPAVIQPNQSVSVTLAMVAPAGTAVGIKNATLEIKSNDPDQPAVNVAVRGLATTGTGGANEPSLQTLLDLFQIPIVTGDRNPATADLFSNAEPLLPNDEVVAPRLIKAGTGPVTVEPLAVFGVNSSPAVRFGWYDAGSPQGKNELFWVRSADAQSVLPPADGATSFDPGARSFGFYSMWPGFGSREIYSEDVLNTIENTEANRRKVRYYPLKNPDGSVVPNALVMAHEEFINASPNGNYDNQDIVAIIRNVAVAPAAPELGLENADGAPYYDRLAFSRIQNPGSNGTHEVATLRLRNTGTAPLTLTGAQIVAGPYQVAAAPAMPHTIGVGQTADVQVRFNVGGGRLHGGTLRLTTNDPDEATLDVPLAGYWQVQPENQQEPTLPEILQILDYRTALANAGQVLSNGGRIEAVGDEVLAPYWVRADLQQAVTVRQVAAFHTVNEGHAVRWYHKGASGTLRDVLTHSPTDAQTLLPRVNGNTGPAVGTFAPTSATPFGFKINAEWSDPTLNPRPSGQPQDQGHHVRFFPLRDRTGGVVRNTWLMIMDFAGVNYDYNDNVYVISNMRPENPPAPATPLASVRPEGGFRVDWTDNAPTSRTAGYNVYRSQLSSSGFVKINDAPVTGSEFDDATASRGGTYFYRVSAVDAWGGESAQSAAVRTDVTPPAMPQSLTATPQADRFVLSWAANADADLVGYRVLRSDLQDGVYTHLANITETTFADTVSPGGFTWHYRVIAVDVSGNESEPATTSASRPGGLGAVLTAPDVEAGGATSHAFAITFSDNAVVSAQSLADSMLVTGPGGFSQAATVVALVGRTATFSFTPPGGSWNVADNGTYTVSVQPNKVGDGQGTFLSGAVGTFGVTVPEEPIPTIDLGVFTQNGKKFGGKRIVRENLTVPVLRYRFVVTNPARVRSSLARLRQDVNFELTDEAGNVLMTSAKPGRKPEKLMRPVAAGTYYLRLTGTAQTPYILKLLVSRPTKRDLALLSSAG